MIAGVVLAAGEGRRIGIPKAFLRMGTGRESFLERAVSTIRSAGVSPVVVVVSPVVAQRVEGLVRGATVCLNPEPGRGQLSSLQVALEHLFSPHLDALLVLPVDVPLVAPATASRLVGVWGGARPAIVRPTRGTVHGHPVIFDARVFAELRAADPAAGAKLVVRKYATSEGDVAIEDDGAFIDIDTVDDYRMAFGCDPAV